jgi:cyclic beta-1,2-glucan synthetase
VAAYQTVSIPEAGRIVGHPHHAAPGPDRESAAGAARIAADRIDRNRADYWADQMTESPRKDPKSLIL